MRAIIHGGHGVILARQQSSHQFGYYSQLGNGLTNTVQFEPSVRRQFSAVPS